MPTRNDPLKSLQRAAALAAEHTSPGERAVRVIVFGASGAKLLDAAVPACCCAGNAGEPGVQLMPAVVPGWAVTDRAASFDGQSVPVSPSRLRLLRVLVEAAGPVTAKELTALAFDKDTDDANTRYHIRELKKELNRAFTFDGDVLQGDADGYRLVLR